MGMNPQTRVTPSPVIQRPSGGYQISGGGITSDNAALRRATDTMSDTSRVWRKALPLWVVAFFLVATPTQAAVWDCDGAAGSWTYEITDNATLTTILSGCAEDTCYVDNSASPIYACPSGGLSAPDCWEAGATADDTADNIVTAYVAQAADYGSSGYACVAAGNEVTCSFTTPMPDWAGNNTTVYLNGESTASLTVTDNLENDPIEPPTCVLHEDTEGETVYVYATNTVEVAATNTEAVAALNTSRVAVLALWLVVFASTALLTRSLIVR